MRKKLLVGLLTCAMVVSLGACGGTDTGSETLNQNNSKEDTTVEVDENETASSMKVVICNKNYYEYDDEIETNLFSGSVEGVVLADESKDAYPKLYESLESAWEEKLKSGDENAETMASDARSLYDEMLSYDTDMSYFMSYESDQEANVCRADEKVLSYRVGFSEFMGGAHGMYGNGGYTYDVQTGNELKLSDVITDLDAYGNLLYERVASDYSHVLEEYDDASQVQDMILEEVKGDVTNWVLEADGIVYFFNPYDIASYAAGAQTVKISYNEAKEIFNEDYLPDENNAYITSGDEFIFDWDSDGDLNYLTVTQHYDDSADGDYGIEGNYNGFSINENYEEVAALAEDIYLYSIKAYMVYFPDATPYLLVDCGTENDYHVLVVCDMSDGKATEVGRYDVKQGVLDYDSDTGVSKIYAYTDLNALEMTEHFDRLSTYDAGGEYQFLEDGTLSALSEYAHIKEWIRDSFELTTLKDITADVVNEDGEVIESDIQISAGEKLSIYRTAYPSDAMESSVDCLLEDGRIVRFEYVSDGEGNRTVSGENEADIFDGIMYAG